MNHWKVESMKNSLITSIFSNIFRIYWCYLIIYLLENAKWKTMWQQQSIYWCNLSKQTKSWTVVEVFSFIRFQFYYADAELSEWVLVLFGVFHQRLVWPINIRFIKFFWEKWQVFMLNNNLRHFLFLWS